MERLVFMWDSSTFSHSLLFQIQCLHSPSLKVEYLSKRCVVLCDGTVVPATIMKCFTMCLVSFLLLFGFWFHRWTKDQEIALQLTLNSFNDMRDFMLAKFLEHKQDFVDFSWRFVITFGDKVFFDFFLFCCGFLI
ncbi:transmembrane protein, putative [Medicago truncatula]|uniref:Transmembrane protein, putative n=1 Tax=Medicago truncatula TaxID=3880 RepID=A0A072TTB5_MEDTR|nr:transmembrane protein, putative [Medicago truncatula]